MSLLKELQAFNIQFTVYAVGFRTSPENKYKKY